MDACEPQVSVGELVRRLRTKRGWTLDQLSERTADEDGTNRIHPTDLSQIERGLTGVGVERAIKFARVFRMSYKHFLSKNRSTTPAPSDSVLNESTEIHAAPEGVVHE